MSNLYQIVDSEDVLTGHKYREDIDYSKDYYRVAAVWITNSTGQVLLAQRLLSKDKDPGKWGPAAAGTLEQGESYESNAYKELEEEIGLSGITLEVGPKMKLTTPRKYFCQWYRGVSDKSEKEFVPQLTEVEKVQWIDIQSLAQDVAANPDKYVPSMSRALKALSSQ